MDEERPDFPDETPTVDLPPGPGPRDIVGPYHLLQRLGEGGMGEVYLAEQRKPVRRRVALKLIKHGLDSKRVAARFESERQALAMMDHPNIAKVLDAGTADNGAPYFVMEYVQGLPIDRHCDEKQLSTAERLELFVKVCHGVQHAHEKAILHRDLKPSNILVATEDDVAVPKIIDFGVAKATDQQLTERTLFTELGQIVGTPEYMSPEQAAGLGDVDTRTDVYSLGVVLYKLLAGSLPFEPRELRSSGWLEMQRRIREEEPPRPSTRAGYGGDATTEAARNRRLDPSALVRRLRGDLDWITMKAMEKDPARRYAFPAQLAADVARHLANEPVSARPPSLSYLAGKFARRHRAGVAFAGVLVVVVLAAAVGLALQAGRIVEERDRANVEAERARKEARTSRRVSDFLVQLFGASDPEESKGRELTARELLERGAEQVDQELQEEPEVQAEMLRTIGSVYTELSLYEEARPLLERALQLNEALPGDHRAEVAASLDELATLQTWAGENESAEELARRSVVLRESLLGAEHSDVATSLNTLGNALSNQGRNEEAAEVHSRALTIREEAFGPFGEEVASSVHNLASQQFFLGRLEEAEKLYLRSAAIEERNHGPVGADLASSLHVVAIVYEQMGRFEDALAMENRALAMREEVLGPDHTHTAMSLTTLGNIYRKTGRPEDAVPLIRRAVAAGEKAWSSGHGELRWMQRSLGRALVDVGDYLEAEERMLRAIAIAGRDGDDRSLPPLLNVLGSAYSGGQRYEAAESAYRRSLEIDEREFGVDDPETTEALAGLAELAARAGRHQEAERLYVRTIAIVEEAWGPDDPELLGLLRAHAGLLREVGRENDAGAIEARIRRGPEPATGRSPTGF